MSSEDGICKSAGNRCVGASDDADLRQAQLAEAKRILQRKLSIRQKTVGQHSAEKTAGIVNTLLAMLEDQQGQPEISLQRVEDFATELMVARTFADALELTVL